MIEHFFTCPFCFTEISILIDPSVKDQQYIEDCERCCRPIEFSIKTNGIELLDVQHQGLAQ